MKRTLLTLLFIAFLFSLQAQDTLSINNHKWGEVSNYEKNLTVCDFDSSAKAVVLFHDGIMNFGYKDGFRTYYHKRIKILDQDEAEELAQIKLYYIENDYSDNEKYWSYGAKEIRAQAINFDENGNKIITELSKNDIINETKNSKFGKYKSFTIPNVQAGTIIEYSYIIQSWYLSEVDWFFQEEIPTIESSFELYTSKQKMSIDPIMIGNKLVEKYNGKTINRWTLSNVPAIKDEKYSASKNDYAEHIIFKPSGYFKSIRDHESNRYVYVEFENSWEQIAEKIIKQTNYKSYSSHKSHFKGILNSAINTNDVDSLKMIKAYDYVRKHFNWNEQTRYWINHKFNDFVEFNKGSSAEINIYLVMLLKNAGLDAHLALLSTRDDGKIIDDTPFKSQFNQAIAYVKIGAKNYFLNATNSIRPYYMLDAFDYNQKALILDEENVRWEELPDPLVNKLIVQTQINIRDDSAIYTIKLKTENQKAYKYINKIDESESKTAFTDYITNAFDEVENINIHWMKNSDPEISEEPFIVEFEVAIALEEIENGGFYELIANHIVSWSSNPFVTDNRQLPVDFYSPIYSKFIVSIQTSDDYTILTDPQSLRLMLPYEGGYYSGSVVKHSDQKLMIISNINLKKSVFYTDEYPAIKEMVSQMIDFELQPIIIQEK